MEKEKGWLPYILFVITSSFVGFGTVYATCRGFMHFIPSTSILFGIIAVIIYFILSILLRKPFKAFFLSEIFLYLYFGFLTTVINNVLFYVFNEKLLVEKFSFAVSTRIIIAQIVSFIAAVLFAYITNKFFVFNSFVCELKSLMKEIFQFFGARFITFLIETTGILVLVNYIHVNDMIAKVVMSVICIIINYIVSKLIIFKDKKDEIY